MASIRGFPNGATRRPSWAGTEPCCSGNAYKQQYGVIVICFDEAQQIAVYEAMKQQYPNNKIKVVTT